MINIDKSITPKNLENSLNLFWALSGEKIKNITDNFDSKLGAPVFTVNGKYSTRGWTEWTHGFQFGSAILQYDATGDPLFLSMGRQQTLDYMAPHISHNGVHDHGFNNLSTYGNLLRLMQEGKIEQNPWEKSFYELAIKISGSVQASRWTELLDGGYIYSFNGPHSLFVDTIRSCRILVASHLLGHNFHSEGDKKISLLERAIQHILSTAKYSVFYGEDRDKYDCWGRTAHESIFNINDGQFRCPNSQQGYTGFSTWTRGLAWGMLGFSEELEVLDLIDAAEFENLGEKASIMETILKAAKATCDFYIEYTPICGVPYWDTGAPNLHRLGNYLDRPADPFNAWEPVDSSAAAIGSQGLLRLGKYLEKKGDPTGKKYWQAGLTVMKTLLAQPYLSDSDDHQGILLHSIYHEPNGWDNVPQGQKIACAESSMWGDYHIREAALYLQKLITQEPYYQFDNCIGAKKI